MEVLREILHIICVHGFVGIANRDLSRSVQIAKRVQVICLEPRKLTIANLIFSHNLIVRGVQATHFRAQFLEGHLLLIDLFSINLVSYNVIDLIITVIIGDGSSCIDDKAALGVCIDH